MDKHGRKLFHVAISLLIASISLLPACERQPAPPAQTTAPPAAPAFTPPQVNLAAIPPKLQPRVQTLLDQIKQTPQAAEPVGALGSICYVYGDFAAAEPCFARARALAPETMHWAYYEGLAADGAGRKEPAIKAYERALELDANYLPVYVRLAKLLTDTDRERAERLCRRAVELNPRDPSAAQALGRCLEAAGDNAGALKQYEESLKLAPNYRDAHEGMTRVLTALGRTEEAEQHKALAARGSLPIGEDMLFALLLRQGFHLDGLLHYAVAVAEKGMFAEADKSLEKAAEVDADGVATAQVTGYIRALEGRYEEAATEYRKALETKPELVELRGRLADVLARQEKYAEAETEFRAVLEKSPDDAFALESYSRLLMVLKRPDDAEKLMRDAIARRPDEAWLYLTLGEILLNADKDFPAFEAFNKTVELTPESAVAIYNLGLIEQRRGDNAKAMEHWKKAVELAPGYLDAHIRLAGTAIQEKDYKAAEQYLRAALTQSPDHPGFNNSLAWLLATSPDDAQRNGEEALRLAEKTCRLTDRKQHAYLDTLAAAQAEAGQFEEAAKTEQTAIDMAPTDANAAASVEAYKKRLALYEQKQPYREAK
jgi:tetratricopeptide (TPR) repeat protein